MTIAERFRADVEQSLRIRPITTPRGQVLADTVHVSFGYPSGRLEVAPAAWIYRDRQSGLEMVFQFYSNFTQNDLICKICDAGVYPISGEGASLQFNSDSSVRPGSLAPTLVHSGLVTVRHRLSREDLVHLIKAAAPKAEALLQLTEDASAWPILVGTSNNIMELIDRLFLYAYCVEQAKRHHRGEDLLCEVL